MFGTRKRDAPFVSSVSLGLIDFSNSAVEVSKLLDDTGSKATEYLRMLAEGLGNALQKLPETARSPSPRQERVVCFVFPSTDLEIAVADELKNSGAHLRLLL